MVDPFPSPSGERRIRLAIESRLEQVALVGKAIRGMLNETVADPVAAYQIEVAVVEAVNNAIKHAYGLEKGHEVEIAMFLAREALTFTISDRGKTMRLPETSTIEYDPKDIARLPEGGMGLFLMREIMDEISYCCREGKNCLTLSKRL